MDLRRTRPLVTGAGGAALVAAVTWLFDRHHGADRRAALRRGGAQLVAGVRSVFAEDELVSDELLADRVRARLLRLGAPAVPGGRVEVTSRDRRVALRGSVPAHAHARIVGQVARVRGVREVIDLLELKPGPGP